MRAIHLQWNLRNSLRTLKANLEREGMSPTNDLSQLNHYLQVVDSSSKSVVRTKDPEGSKTVSIQPW